MILYSRPPKNLVIMSVSEFEQTLNSYVLGQVDANTRFTVANVVLALLFSYGKIADYVLDRHKQYNPNTMLWEDADMFALCVKLAGATGETRFHSFLC